MKLKLLILYLILLVSTGSMAQVTMGTGSAPPEKGGAYLQLKEKDDDPATGGVNAKRGLLLPRTNLKTTGDPTVSGSTTAHTAGTTFYNMTTDLNPASGDALCPGVYAWNGSKWMRLHDPCPDPCAGMTVNDISDQTVCNNSSTTAVAFGSSTAGATFDWVNDTPSIGLAASGTGNIAAFTATNTTANPVTASITVTPPKLGVCTGTARTFTITVNPTPTTTFTASATSASVGDIVTYTTQSGMSDYTWTIPGTSGTDYTISSGSTASYSVSIEWLTGGGDKTVMVNYTDNGCPGTAATVTTSVATINTSTNATVTACATSGLITSVSTEFYMFTYQKMNLFANFSGGTPTSYQWMVDGTAVTDETDATFTYDPSSVITTQDELGNYKTTVNITCLMEVNSQMVQPVNNFKILVVHVPDEDLNPKDEIRDLQPIYLWAFKDGDPGAGAKSDIVTFAHVNLGAENENDPCNCLGDLYQWGGREKDGNGITTGHFRRVLADSDVIPVTIGSAATSGNAKVAESGDLDAATGQVIAGKAQYGKFIKSLATSFYDWRSTRKHDLWGGDGELDYSSQPYNPTWQYQLTILALQAG